MANILLFENDHDIIDNIKYNIESNGHKITVISDPGSLKEDNEFWSSFDLVILDLMMGYSDLPPEWQEETFGGLLTGFVVFKKICKNPKLPVIVVTGLNDKDLLDIVRKELSNAIILSKPIDYEIINKHIIGMIK